MKKTKVFLTAVGVLVALGGAFATKAVNRLVPVEVFYMSNGLCTTTETEVSPCLLSGGNTDCTKPELGTIYQSRAAVNQCADPYQTIEP